MSLKILSPFYFIIAISFVFAGLREDISTQKQEFIQSYSLNYNYKDQSGQEAFHLQERIDNYYKSVENIKNLVFYISIIVIIGLIVIIYKSDTIEVPFISTPVPRLILYFIIVGASLYIWVNFGLEFNSGIDSRLTLHAFFSDAGTQTYNQSKPYNILADNALIDNWCSYYFDIFNIGAPKSLTFFMALGLFGIYGVLVALLFAVCFISIHEINTVFNTYAAFVLNLFSMLLLAFSTYMWFFKHPYAAFFLAFIWGMCAIFTFVWAQKGEKLSEVIKKVGV